MLIGEQRKLLLEASHDAAEGYFACYMHTTHGSSLYQHHDALRAPEQPALGAISEQSQARRSIVSPVQSRLSGTPWAQRRGRPARGKQCSSSESANSAVAQKVVRYCNVISDGVNGAWNKQLSLCLRLSACNERVRTSKETRQQAKLPTRPVKASERVSIRWVFL